MEPAAICPAPYLPSLATIEDIVDETPDIKTFRVAFVEQELREKFTYRPGQFAEVSVFGRGEATFDIASSPSVLRGALEFTVKRVGKVTEALHELNPGDVIGVRGPYGNWWPAEDWQGKNLIFIGGGVGLPPLRTLLNEVLHESNRQNYGEITVIYGARSPADLVYKRELRLWEQRDDVEFHVTVDAGDETWTGNVGFVPQLLEQVNPSPDNAVALTVGPPIMIKFVLAALKQMGFSDEQIFTSLENRMKCGVGKCGRCNVGPYYVCLHGPVFSFAQIKELPQDF